MQLSKPQNCTSAAQHKPAGADHRLPLPTSEDEPREKLYKGRSMRFVSIKPQYKPQIKEKLRF